MKNLLIAFFICTFSLSSFAVTYEQLRKNAEFNLEVMGDDADPITQEYYNCLIEETDGFKCHIKLKRALHNIVRETGHGVEKGVRGARDILGETHITICGQDLIVPTVMYAACRGSAYLLPAGCTVGAVTSAGTACAAAISTMVASCGVTVARMTQIAAACINGH